MAGSLGPRSAGGELKPALSTMGGGSLPGETIASWALVLHSNEYSAQAIADWLRLGSPPVLARIIRERVWLDPPRTVLPAQDGKLLAILKEGMP